MRVELGFVKWDFVRIVLGFCQGCPGFLSGLLWGFIRVLLGFVRVVLGFVRVVLAFPKRCGCPGYK